MNGRMRGTGVIILMAVAGIATPGAQTVEKTRFEVSSVKPCAEEPNTGNQRRQEWRLISPGHISIDCITLARIIFFAHAGIGSLDDPLLNMHPTDPDIVRGGPGWIRSDRFTIDAKTERPVDRTVMMGPMLRALLEDRFQLKTHRQTDEADLYALTVAKGGLKIKSIGDDGCTQYDPAQAATPNPLRVLNGDKPVCGSFTATADGADRKWILGGVTLARFATQNLSSVLDRYVIDRTGVSGLFNITLTFGIDESIRRGVFGGAPVGTLPADLPRGPSIFTALEEQLGVKLQPTRAPVDVLVIDRAEKAAAN
jgi:uncharacterized protein (TIGR03435 family)